MLCNLKLKSSDVENFIPRKGERCTVLWTDVREAFVLYGRRFYAVLISETHPMPLLTARTKTPSCRYRDYPLWILNLLTIFQYEFGTRITQATVQLVSSASPPFRWWPTLSFFRTRTRTLQSFRFDGLSQPIYSIYICKLLSYRYFHQNCSSNTNSHSQLPVCKLSYWSDPRKRKSKADIADSLGTLLTFV